MAKRSEEEEDEPFHSLVHRCAREELDYTRLMNLQPRLYQVIVSSVMRTVYGLDKAEDSILAMLFGVVHKGT